MKNIVIVCLAVCLFAVPRGLCADLEKSVQPIDWSRFSKKGLPSAEYKLSSKIMENAARRAHTWAPVQFKSSENNDRFIVPNKNEEPVIRLPACSALGLATAIRTGLNEKKMGGSTEELTKTAAKLVKGVVAVHKSNGGAWGDHWQSSLWTAQVGRAAWLLWDDLDKETREMTTRMIIHEANRNYKVRYWNGEGGDSKSEENSWDSMSIQLAVAMFPNHPNVERWKLKCSELVVGSYCRPSDMERETPLIDGKAPKEWLNGYNIREDGIVINHNLIHNDYMSSIAHLQMSGFMVFSLAGVPAPESTDFNFDLMYKTLVTHKFDSPPFKKPGGTMFVPGSPDQYYPKGTDWSDKRYACFLGMDTLAYILGYEQDLSHKAKDWIKLRAEKIYEMQSRHEDGRMYASGEFDTYGGREGMVFWAISDAHILLWLADHNAIMGKANWFEN